MKFREATAWFTAGSPLPAPHLRESFEVRAPASAGAQSAQPPFPAAHVYADALDRLARRPDEAVSIDVRLPFCPMHCIYCGCDIDVTHDDEVIDRYLDALECEVAMVASRLGERREVLQLHFGGGTPNYLSDTQLARAVRIVTDHFAVLAETEASIDCDPRRASAYQLERMRALGLRQVTFGMVDLQPCVQRVIGRFQSAQLMHDACRMAVRAGFESVAIDFLHGLPEQTGDGMRMTLREIIDMGPDRVICHEYVHRPDLHRQQCAIVPEQVPEPRERDALFAAAVESLTDVGYTWIGIDHFALDTDELSLAQEDRRLGCNAIAYSAIPARHVLGFGSGATGDVDGTLVRNEIRPLEWRRHVQMSRLPTVIAHRRSHDEARRCEAAMQLLCNLELPAHCEAQGLTSAYERLRRRANDGLVTADAARIRVTPRGRFALRDLCMDLVNEVESETVMEGRA